ncbi:D-glycero-beta-D-manno-heptose 1-phosphate adenylyltransferase [Candidatus Aerophobetes bacterium]|uniref:D-glycero-beta-D-manno-heptose 1-phosphate adenylyltransferase n=1 Tax=Aerophobetes bacterium TaxID=2030807 RepID=A0A2A4X8R9_UNCAE|nr:MAG: D-glycero-beta-D-manno-heptose 1-phosphate adenylyltransferase [Candidatus Aerophobetes bacterium]
MAHANIKSRVDLFREEGNTIATINGCFDLLHVGHLHMLYLASKQADILIVMLNSDASVKKYKGQSRPIHLLEERMQMIAALEFVDFVTVFEESTPNAVLEIIRPDVHVNSVEYGENCIEAPVVKKHGGKIALIPFIEGFSSTSIVEKIKQSEATSATNS